MSTSRWTVVGGSKVKKTKLPVPVKSKKETFQDPTAVPSYDDFTFMTLSPDDSESDKENSKPPSQDAKKKLKKKKDGPTKSDVPLTAETVLRQVDNDTLRTQFELIRLQYSGNVLLAYQELALRLNVYLEPYQTLFRGHNILTRDLSKETAAFLRAIITDLSQPLQTKLLYTCVQDIVENTKGGRKKCSLGNWIMVHTLLAISPDLALTEYGKFDRLLTENRSDSAVLLAIVDALLPTFLPGKVAFMVFLKVFLPRLSQRVLTQPLMERMTLLAKEDLRDIEAGQALLFVQQADAVSNQLPTNFRRQFQSTFQSIQRRLVSPSLFELCLSAGQLNMAAICLREDRACRTLWERVISRYPGASRRLLDMVPCELHPKKLPKDMHSAARSTGRSCWATLAQLLLLVALGAAVGACWWQGLLNEALANKVLQGSRRVWDWALDTSRSSVDRLLSASEELLHRLVQ